MIKTLEKLEQAVEDNNEAEFEKLRKACVKKILQEQEKAFKKHIAQFKDS